MDALIKRYDFVEDGDLRLCPDHGVAYQSDMRVTAKYDESYFNKCLSYENAEIANKINAGRVALVDKYAGGKAVVADVGIGSGEFIKKRPGPTMGYDVNPVAIDWLKQSGKWAGDLSNYAAFTFWDVIEHVEQPDSYFKMVPDSGHLFTSIPVFKSLNDIRKSKHYRPGEHLYYWTATGFVEWMALRRFRLLERQTYEMDAGRDSIVSYAFRRDGPDYHDTVAQYVKLHSASYGNSAWLYFDEIAGEVKKLNPKSILDYGCGRSDLVAHFWRDGERFIAKYDPAIPQFKTMPDRSFELVLCCDVMEHILMCDVDRVLREVADKSRCAIFTISMRPARATLPDGRNAHVTLLKDTEWTRWIKSVFGVANRVPLQWDHMLMLKTW